jgi:uncharacterized membrane protein YkoI
LWGDRIMKRWLSLVIVMMAGLFVLIGLVWKPWVDQAEALTKEAIEKVVLEQYPGEVIATTLLGDVYKMQLKTETGLYALKVDSLNGEIVSLELLNKYVVLEYKDTQTKDDASEENAPADSLPIDEENGAVETKPIEKGSTATKAPTFNSPIDKKTNVQPTKILTTEQAAALSTKHVNGTVDDIELRESSKESYYLVEINAADGREAVVQVNAITGVIMSVIWDDKNNDDKDSKNDDDTKKKDDDDEG